MPVTGREGSTPSSGTMISSLRSVPATVNPMLGNLGGDAMKSTKLQLLVTLAAGLAAVAFFAVKGFPPSKDLYEASWQGDLAEARRAVSWGRRAGQWELHEAMETGHSDLAVFLITTGANVKVRYEDRSTPLHWAARWGLTKVAKCLMDHGGEVNARDNEGETALHFAVRWNKKDVVELLIARGAEVDSENNDGTVPLDWAVLMGNTAVAELLRQHGAKE